MKTIRLPRKIKKKLKKYYPLKYASILMAQWGGQQSFKFGYLANNAKQEIKDVLEALETTIEQWGRIPGQTMHNTLKIIIDLCGRGEQAAITEELLYDAFENNYNEFKGETQRTEMKRWLKLCGPMLDLEYVVEETTHPIIYHFRQIKT